MDTEWRWEDHLGDLYIEGNKASDMEVFHADHCEDCFSDIYEDYEDSEGDRVMEFEIPAKVRVAIQLLDIGTVPSQVMTLACDVIVAYLLKKEV